MVTSAVPWRTGVNGVQLQRTSVRSPGGIPYEAVEEREAFDAGLRPGPRAFTTGHLMEYQRVYYKMGIAISSVEVCLHHPTGSPHGAREVIGPGDCRKPKPGQLLRAMQNGGFDPESTWMIGDSTADIEAAHQARLRSALVFAQNRCELCPLRQGSPITPDVVAPRFDELAERILTWSTRAS